MPRHPPNAQKNKQQKTHEQNKKQFCRRNLTVRCSRPLYSSQPTHPHPPTTPNKSGAPDGSGNQGALPQNPDSMPPPHHARAPTTSRPPQPQQPQQPTTAGVSPMPAPDKPTTPHTSARRSAAQPFRKGRPPAGPDPSTVRARSTARKPPPQSILRKEVIQPHLPVRLPCYDFVPITSPTFDRSP